MKKACLLILFVLSLYSYAGSSPYLYSNRSYTFTQSKFKKTTFVAKVDGYDIAYDLYYPDKDNEDNADSVVIYAKKGKMKKVLLSKSLDALELTEVSVKYFYNQPFIYFATGTFHGDIYGEIYSFNTSLIRAERIDELPLRFSKKAPKGYYQNKNYGIRIEENDRIFDGIIYRNDDNGDLSYTIDVEYKMVKIGNRYKLNPIKQTVSNYR